MAEQYKNTPSTTLNGAINNSVTTITVTDGSVFPATGAFSLKCESEYMICTARATNVLTVVRAAEGSTAASHADAKDIISPLTARGLLALPARFNVRGIIGSRPTVGDAGRVYNCSDDYVDFYDDGTNWNAFGPSFSLVSPDSSAFTDLNSPTTVVDNGGIKISHAAASNSWVVHGKKKAIGSGDRFAQIAFVQNMGPIQFSMCVLGFMNSGDNRAELIRVSNDSSHLQTQINKLTDITSGSGASGVSTQYEAQCIFNSGLIWFRIERVGTSLNYYAGSVPDKALMYFLGTTSISTNVGTADTWFFGIVPYSQPAAMRVVSWEEGAA